MATIRVKAEKQEYMVRDAQCIGRECLRLHPVAARGATSSGSRSAGYNHYECARRCHFGCPTPIPEASKALAKARQADGYKVLS